MRISDWSSEVCSSDLVEDALAGQQSAQQRVVTSRQAVEAARAALRANEARWRAGAISMFELEDSRRQFNGAQESAIAAARDRAQAWVAGPPRRRPGQLAGFGRDRLCNHSFSTRSSRGAAALTKLLKIGKRSLREREW